MISPFKHLFKGKAAGGIQIEDDTEGVQKVSFLNIISMTGILALTILGGGEIGAGDGALIFLLIAFILPFFHSYILRIRSGALLATVLMGIFFIHLFVNGEASHTNYTWSYACPLLSTFFLGARTGTAISLVFLLAAVTCKALFTENLDMVSILRFAFFYLAVTLFSSLLEVVRGAIQRRLAHKNFAIKAKMEEFKGTEETLRKTRDELEQRVDHRTAALRSAVEHLQQQIMEREKAERALLDSHQRFIAVLEGIPVDVYVTEIQSYEILFVNRHMKDALGSDDVMGQPCWRALRGLSDPCGFCSEFKPLDEKGAATGLVTWEAKNAYTGKWYVNHARAIRWDGDRMVRLLIATDITDRKLAEEVLQRSNEQLETRVRERTENIACINEALRMEILHRKEAQAEALCARDVAEQANRAKSEFLANMSHELRTPLNHVIGFTELLADKKVGDLNQMQEEYLQDVLGSSRHLLSLINDVLDLSKIEAGKLELNASEVQIKALLEGSLIMVREKAMKHGITLDVDYEGAPDLIRADERKLRQVMYNLLSNAMKFTPEGGAIHIKAARVLPEPEYPSGKECLKITVSDSGIGLRKEDLERIFNPFEQVENSATRIYRGTGLGLALSRRFVGLHGGRIWVESEGLQKGSTFAFVIPIEQPDAAPSMS